MRAVVKKIKGMGHKMDSVPVSDSVQKPNQLVYEFRKAFERRKSEV